MKSAKLNTRENYKLTKPRNPRKLIPAKINPYKVFHEIIISMAQQAFSIFALEVAQVLDHPVKVQEKI